MAITARAEGTWATLTADGAVTIPGSPQAGDMMYLLVAWKPFGTTAQVTSPTGWTELTEFTDGAVANGNGVGSVKVACYYKEHSGSESNPTVDFSASPDVAGAVIIIFQKGAAETWDVPRFVTASMTNWTTSSQTVTASSTTRIDIGDLIIGLIGIRDDSATMTRPTTGIAAAGVTFSGNYVEYPATHLSTTTGFDLAVDAGYRIVSAGPTTVAPTMTGTISAAETGAALWILQGVTTAGLGQAQASIKQTYIGHAQAQATITGISRNHGQAQAHVVKFAKQVGSGQAHATIAGQFSTFNDTFTRTVSPGWGTADNGDTWTSTNAIYSTNGSVGQFTSSQQLSNLNFTVINRGTEITFDFSIDAFRVEGNSNIFYVALKGSGNDSQLDGYIAIINPTSPGNTLQFGIQVVDTSPAAVTFANPYTLNDTYRVKVQILGSFSSTRIRSKAWKVGDTEPGWLQDTNSIALPYTPTHPQIRPTTHTPTITTTIDNISSQSAWLSYTGQAQAFITNSAKSSGQAQAVIDTGIHTIVDTFTRSVSDGVGDAETGGTYIVTGTATQLDVDGSKLVYTASTTASVTLTLNRFYQQGTAYEEYFDFSVVSFGAGTGNITLTPFLAYQGGFNGVDAQLIINNSTGAATIRGNSVGTISTGDNYRLKFRFKRTHPQVGSNSYEVRYSLWNMTDDANEPGFVFDTDTQSANGAFNTGVLFLSLSPGNSSVQMSFDNLNAYQIGWTDSGQAQASIKQTYRGHAQSQAQIKQTYRSHGQAQAEITALPEMFYGTGQAQAFVNPITIHQGVAETVTSDTTTTVIVPPHKTGDRLLFLWGVDGIETTIWPSNIKQIAYQDNSAMTGEIYYTDVDGTEGWNPSGGSTFDVTISSAEQATVAVVVIGAGYFEPLTPPEPAPVAFSNNTNPNNTSYTTTWGAAPQNLWISFVAYDDGADTVTGYPAGYSGNVNYTSDATGAGVGVAYIITNAASENPGTWTLSAAEQYTVWNIANRPNVEGLSLARGLGQAQALIAGATSVHGQAQAWIENTYNGLGQAQGTIKATYTDKTGQAQAQVKQTYYGLGQSQATILRTYTDSTGQAQGTVLRTYTDKTGQAQGTVKTTYYGLGQAQARILNTYHGLGQAQGTIKQVYFGLGQAQGTVKNTYRGLAQAQGTIKTTYFGLGQAQAWIETTTSNTGQAQAQIKQVYNAHGQAQSWIEQTYNQHGQAQGTVKTTYFQHGQAQGQIKQVYNVHGQAQAWIENTYVAHGQAQAWIKQTYSAVGQAQAQIKQVYNVHGQAQGTIEQVYNQHGQAQAWVENTYYGLGQAQAKLNAFDINSHGQAQGQVKQVYYGLGQAQAKINAFDVQAYGQANARIYSFDYNQHGQAQALIAGSSVQFGQAQAKINAFGVNAHGQAQADIKQTYYGLGQSQASIKQTYYGLGQAQAWIEQTSNGSGQSEAWIKSTYFGLGQSQAWIETTYVQHGQAQGQIKQTYVAHGQAGAWIEQTYSAHGQSQAAIKQTYYGLAQAQGTIKTTYFAHGQAQANISFEGNAAFGQAQAKIKGIDVNASGQAQALVKNTYNVHGQSQGWVRDTCRAHGQAQGTVKTTYFVHAQAQGWIEAVSSSHGQAQAQIKQTYVVHGQAQGRVQNVYYGSGQAQTYILLAKFGSGQAQASIKTSYTVTGQAQAQIQQSYSSSGQAQALIAKTTNASGQAQGWIETTYRGFGQAQAQILTGRFGTGQAQAQIILSGQVNSAQAQAFIIKAVGVGQARALIVTTHTLANVSVSDDAPIVITMVDEAIMVTLADEDSNTSITSDEDIFDIELSDEHPFTLLLEDEAFI